MQPLSAASMVPLASFPAFIRFWYSRLAGTSANQMLMVAVGWQMYDLTGSAWDLGLVGLARSEEHTSEPSHGMSSRMPSSA